MRLTKSRPKRAVLQNEPRKRYEPRRAKIAEREQQANTAEAPMKAMTGIRGLTSATKERSGAAAAPSAKAKAWNNGERHFE